MGVPSFFRWLQDNYPNCIKSKIKQHFDNLYVDLNGIIHPCSHPENGPLPKNENEIMDNICYVLDLLIKEIKPRKLLYLAIDGVAPRAKMNQQRARRFRTSMVVEEKENEIKKIIKEKESKGVIFDIKKYKFDSNSITPGTAFMERLSKNLKKYIEYRIRENKYFSRIKIIFSDSKVPGEGEHKIINFIKEQKKNKNYNSNIKHVLYGSDADLIMLGLSTHEKYFYILRDEFSNKKILFCEICNSIGHNIYECEGKGNKIPKFQVPKHIIIDLNILRYYLKKTLKIPGIDTNFNKSLDDWIFLCFFVGNDFLPHIHSLEIREGAINLLVKTYKKVFKMKNNYLINNGIVNIKQVVELMNLIGKLENDIFKKRYFENKKLENDDYIKFYKIGYQERYYNTKFGVDYSLKFVSRVSEEYMKGLCWVAKYYFIGCSDWSWYYPFHYAPFAQDLARITKIRFSFKTNSSPAKPLEQLLSTLPPSSSNLLPKPIGKLMLDSKSPIIEYYPKDFTIDLNGKKQLWQGVVILPFIEEEKIKKALKGVYKYLNNSEVERDSHGKEKIYEPLSI